MNRKTYRNIVLLVLIFTVIGISFIAGIFLGYDNRPEVDKITSLFNKETENTDLVDFEPFWKAWNVINDRYVSTDGPTNQEKVWSAIAGLVSSLDDPYTVFFPPKESKNFADDINGEFQGVGMEIGIRDDILTVIAPLKDTPADRSGIKPGDIVIKINDTLSADLTIDEAVDLIRGPKGTDVILTVLHADSDIPMEITITRDTITVPTIKTEVIHNESKNTDVFVIHLYTFTGNSPELFRSALSEFINSDTDKLIIDLRGNPGGFLEVAVDMASFFLPIGKTVVREDFGNGEKENIYRSKGYDLFNDNLKLAILVNGGSASASEIFAGALSEHGKAILVGTQTFGKGSVQELIPITKDTSLKITIARWLTPNGISISEGGLTPDEIVEMTREDFEAGNDLQMNRAIEILSDE